MKDNEMEMVDLVARKAKETHKHSWVTLKERERMRADAEVEIVEDQICSVCAETRSRVKKDW